MKNLQKHIEEYLHFCETQKNLNSKLYWIFIFYPR